MKKKVWINQRGMGVGFDERSSRGQKLQENSRTEVREFNREAEPRKMMKSMVYTR
jgi:hypothetical protein